MQERCNSIANTLELHLSLAQTHRHVFYHEIVYETWASILVHAKTDIFKQPIKFNPLMMGNAFIYSNKNFHYFMLWLYPQRAWHCHFLIHTFYPNLSIHVPADILALNSAMPSAGTLLDAILDMLFPHSIFLTLVISNTFSSWSVDIIQDGHQYLTQYQDTMNVTFSHLISHYPSRHPSIYPTYQDPFHKNFMQISLNKCCYHLKKVRSGDNFAHVMTAQLSWHVQICDFIGSLEFKLQQKGSKQVSKYEPLF